MNDKSDAGMIVRPSWEKIKTSQPFLKVPLKGKLKDSAINLDQATIKSKSAKVAIKAKRPSVTLMTGDIRTAKIEAQRSAILAQIEKLSGKI